MAHIHGIYDTDAHFSLDPVTRILKNELSTKPGVVQYDHNSEIVTFELPRQIEGHDMSLCDKVRVHYINIETATKKQNKGLYDVKDLQLSQTDPEKVVCSWRISRNATQLVGTLAFIIRFACTENGEEVYGLSSAKYGSLQVSEGINNDEAIVEEYADILDDWEARIQALEKGGGGSGGLSITDDGNGNVTITSNGSGGLSITDDGNGNVVIGDVGASGGGGANSASNIFAGRTASFYGDSLTEVNYHYTKGYHKWVSDILGFASYNNYGVGGYKVSDVYNTIKSVNDTADIIFAMCGVNDQTFSVPLGTMGDATIETTYGALDKLCALVKQKYPTKLVVFITPHYQTKYPHNEGVTSYEVSKAVREVCEKYTIPVYDNFTLSGIYSTNLSVFTTDNCHWNDIAHEMVGKNLAQFMTNTFHCIHA